MAKVIIVDDDANFCALVIRSLRRAGFDAACHTSPFGTLNAIRKGSFDLVILDINMPGLDGPSLVKLLRETKGLEQTKILLYSLCEEDMLRKIAREAGVTGWVKKSSSQNELIGAVTSALAEHS
ncbi:MAG TPA: response regulator [Polyangiaceae bacterium]|jgi:DNA-binding response OmpR family regulator|nr:response regulator [Polyangiaceae bacterium]